MARNGPMVWMTGLSILIAMGGVCSALALRYLQPSFPALGSVANPSLSRDATSGPEVLPNYDVSPISFEEPGLEPNALFEWLRASSIQPSATSATEDRKRAEQWVQQGGQLYRAGRYEEAVAAFGSAIQHDSQNPLYYYLLAMSQYEAKQRDDARRSANAALALERTSPIASWGQLVSRYQGPARLWVEELRRQARAANKS
jgi:tetratricopeptide (TPR) repeat protein